MNQRKYKDSFWWIRASLLLGCLLLGHSGYAKWPQVYLAKDTIYLEPYDSLVNTVTANDALGRTTPIYHTGNIDSSHIGIYKLKFYTRDTFGSTSDTSILTVIVRDALPPSISLTGLKHVYIKKGQVFIEPGYIVTDNFDSMPVVITGGSFKGSNTAGVFTRTYQAQDFSGNSSGVLTRFIEVKDTVSGIGNISETVLELKLWPNPAKGIITISIANEKPESLSLGIYDICGRKRLSIEKKNLKDENFAIELSGLEPGIYTLSGMDGGRRVSVRFANMQ
jgi:hypothetical protein